MEITLFSTKSYDKEYFEKVNANFNFKISYHKSRLDASTAHRANGAQIVCLFVNDVADRQTLKILKDQGVQLIAMRCAGFNNVDLKAAGEYGIKVVRVPAYSPHAVAEYTLALMLTLSRKTHKAYARTREGNFSLHGLIGFDFYKKTAGIIGTGKIAKALIDALNGLGMNVIAYDVYKDEQYAKEHNFKYVSLDELYANSDIISLHCPLTDDTKFIINKDSIAKMKNGVMIINTGRGQLIHTDDLIEALKSTKVGSAGLDVYEEEADYFFSDKSDTILQDDNLARLLTFNNVIVSSHQAFFTKEAVTNIVETTLENVKAFIEHKELVNEVK